MKIITKPLKWMANQAVSAGRSYTIHHDKRGLIGNRKNGYFVAIHNLMTQESSNKLDFDSEQEAKEWAEKKHYQPKLLELIESCSDVIAYTQAWFKKAKPNPTMSNLWVQTGVHFEEVAEMIESIHGKGSSKIVSVKALADMYKHEMPDDNRLVSDFEELPYVKDELELLDSLCDQIFTAIGTGYLAGYDMEGAFNEVMASNWSKFVDGEPIFHPNGKVAKGDGYKKPDLSKFLRKAEVSKNDD